MYALIYEIIWQSDTKNFHKFSWYILHCYSRATQIGTPLYNEREIPYTCGDQQRQILTLRWDPTTQWCIRYMLSLPLPSMEENLCVPRDLCILPELKHGYTICCALPIRPMYLHGYFLCTDFLLFIFFLDEKSDVMCQLSNLNLRTPLADFMRVFWLFLPAEGLNDFQTCIEHIFSFIFIFCGTNNSHFSNIKNWNWA